MQFYLFVATVHPLSICLSTFCVRGGWPARLLSVMWRVNRYKVPATHFIGLS